MSLKLGCKVEGNYPFELSDSYANVQLGKWPCCKIGFGCLQNVTEILVALWKNITLLHHMTAIDTNVQFDKWLCFKTGFEYLQYVTESRSIVEENYSFILYDSYTNVQFGEWPCCKTDTCSRTQRVEPISDPANHTAIAIVIPIILLLFCVLLVAGFIVKRWRQRTPRDPDSTDETPLMEIELNPKQFFIVADKLAIPAGTEA
ncbi:hypothetical protein BSL78_02308 [Apostichopus japonicus]|uniref:Uncharacterized protein n=1 Tax=Stichopus japonicus TaxID=307972 RepID=A0A2G8LKH0_STIJA|nr:hypothetical protein BSL78_02308 [Apostichopus japonicus]